MSTNIEESPLSDSKMDISDTTNSMESSGVSPVAEHNHNNTAPHAYKVSTFLCSVINNDDSENADKEKVDLDTQVECILNENKGQQSHSNKQVVASHLQELDNRYAENMSRPGNLTLSEKHLSSLTVANSHPLMSPTGTDSDSENGCLVQVKVNRTFNNFPDVVPNRERNMVTDPPAQVINLQATNTLVMKQRVEASSIVSKKNSLNSNNPLATAKNKPSILRTHSPDLLSSGSEVDASQYYAAVEANFQSVALIPNINNANTIFTEGRKSKRMGDVVATGSDDISSLDSISNHSFDDDEDLEHNLASLSPSSSLIDGLDDDDDDDDCEGPEIEDDFPEGSTPTNSKPADSLPQYSAEDERRDSRNWQKITLPDGSTREIDMKVIEPYKRVLSHGGYLNAGGHNAIVIFCACHLPDRSRADYHYVMDNLFLYVVKTLDQLVTEDYVLIYLHGGTSRRNVPPFPWLKKCYQLLDRRLRKSLKSMYLVHPTFWIKSIVLMTRPFVSAKFWRKLIYVKSLHELGTHVAVERAAIPEKVKQYDAKIN